MESTTTAMDVATRIAPELNHIVYDAIQLANEEKHEGWVFMTETVVGPSLIDNARCMCYTLAALSVVMSTVALCLTCRRRRQSTPSITVVKSDAILDDPSPSKDHVDV